MSEPTKEYLFAKAELCTKIARQQEERAGDSRGSTQYRESQPCYGADL
jgi:hypothetical protein